MGRVRIISAGLFFLTRVLAVPYLATAIYLIIVFAIKTPFLNIIEDGKRFEVLYPFTQTPYLLGYNNTFYMLEMIAFIGLCGIFLWLLGNVFQTFREKKLFTPKSVNRLKTFYLLNFLVPLPILIVHIFFSYEIVMTIFFSLLHIILGIFTYFMAIIFEQGLHLQNEQDLYI